MKQISVYDLIKKQNGERFARTIRNYNNGIFEIPNIVNIVKYAGTEAEPILPYLMSLMNIKIKEVPYEDPFVLLKKAGYNAYYADTLEKQNAISKYFEVKEYLCTFRDDNRFKKYYIVNAVKENVDDIKRENFTNPRREDEYGTSVISIQMLKYGGFISIKNRYNHTVENPDNTFNSNPDNIIEGLSYSLHKYFDVDFVSRSNFLSANYIIVHKQIVRYNDEVDGYYRGDGFYVKDGKIIEINKQTEVMMDWYILNLKDKNISSILENNDEEDFKQTAKILTKELQDKKIQVVKNEDKTKSILLDGKEFVRLDRSQMKRLTLEKATKLPNKFLCDQKTLEYFNCPNVEVVGHNVLAFNHTMRHCDMIKAKKIGQYFLGYNYCLQEINIPSAEHIDEGFLWQNSELKSLNLPVVKNIGSYFLSINKILDKLNMPQVRYIAEDVLYSNTALKHIDIPNVMFIDDNFLHNNLHIDYNVKRSRDYLPLDVQAELLFSGRE